MRIWLYIVVLLVAILSLSDCKKDKALANYGGYPNDVGKIMVLKCAVSGCHNTASAPASAGLDLSSWDALFKGSSTGSAVIPFRSDFSSLCYFINTYPELGSINYPTMPYNRDPLSKEEVMTIKNWINDGAPDLNGNVKWADNPNRKKVYITNQGCDVVTVIDAETQLPMRYITVGKDPNTIEVPHMVKVSPDGQYWYVVFVNANIMQKFRCSDDLLVGEAYLGPYYDWNALTISKDNTKAYCVSWVSNGHIASVDLVNMKVINNYGGFFFPHGVCLNDANNYLYVTGQTGNYIMKIDTSLATTQTISLNGLPPSTASSLDPHEVILSKDTTKLYITCQGSNEVRVLDLATNTVTYTIPVGTYPVEIALSETKNKLYVTCLDDITSFPGTHGTVSEILAGAPYTERRIAVGFMPHGIVVDDSKGLVYVASRNVLSSGPVPHHSSVCVGRNGFVNLIDMNTFTLKSKHAELSVDPYGAAIRK